ncbi:MAG TPA: hypothetical protein VLJ59_17505 [Mycobacteriales bacterium]|nr:hypothetical protein [Mycobacteriales bacterium]
MTAHTPSNGVDGRPYVGSRLYRIEDGDRFYGRSTESRDLAEFWRANRLTVLHGASGAGKTSLLLAGVVPLLDRESAEILPLGCQRKRVGGFGHRFPRQQRDARRMQPSGGRMSPDRGEPDVQPSVG